MRRAPVVGFALALGLTLAASSCANQHGVPSSLWNWNRPFAPYRVIDNVYYVGTNGIAQFLITTPAGHFLLDSGFEASLPRLRENVAALGFRFEDVKILLTGHAHIDHVQAHAEVRRLTGATVVSSARDAEIIRAGGKGDPLYDGVYAWTPCPVDRVVRDGEPLTLGGTTVTAHLTPGHTRGALTWTMRVAAPGGGARPLDVVFFPSANINPGTTLVGNARYPEIADDFARSFAIWKALPCDVFLATHGDFYDMRAKRARQERGEPGNPFIDPAGYRAYVAEAEKAFQAQLASER